MKKIIGADAEMFWQNNGNNTVFEQDADTEALSEVEKDAIKENIEDFVNNTRRYLITQGMPAKNLAPSISDPTNHLAVQYAFCAMTYGIPMRIFMGSEQAKLASTTDTENWNSRITSRQNEYLTPYVILNLVKHLQGIGVLPETAEPVKVEWPSMESTDEEKQATTAKTVAEAVAIYVNSGVDMVMELDVFLSKILGWTDDEISDNRIALEESFANDKIGEVEDDEPGRGTEPAPGEGDEGAGTAGDEA